MIKGKYLTVLVFSDEMAEHKQFKLSARMIKAFITLMACCLLLSLSFAALWLRASRQNSTFHDLASENSALKQANERYLSATMEIEKKLKYFDDKTMKLAGMIGVATDDQSVAGLGGASLFENELNQYLRYDLSLIEQSSQLLEARIDSLDEAYKQKSELLDSTPSILPARGWLSSGFSHRVDPFTRKRAFHSGLDISAPIGTPVYAPASGVVTVQGLQGGFGNTIVISHGNGLETRYGHLSRFNTAKGRKVKRGDLIGYVGNTGRSTGPHLHFEIHKDGQAVDPLKYVLEDVKPF
ncbi:MAG: M23 family metallopeptidase [Acidobacteria bacterium]|nr:M23 family metallopeptidase [Acidobacteriota bacterium]MCB9398268.1 M23 family metallopeptidase [Acidobacteriota bacterium]